MTEDSKIGLGRDRQKNCQGREVPDKEKYWPTGYFDLGVSDGKHAGHAKVRFRK